MYSIVCSDTAGLDIGQIIQHTGYINNSNLLPCDGRPLSKIQYPKLYDVIGTQFGGHATGIFNLPDLGARIKPRLVYQDFWETWPCRHCSRIFADGHDRSTWWCQFLKSGLLNQGYEPMTNLEYLELKESKYVRSS